MVLEKSEFDLAACYSIYALHSHYVRYLCKLSTLPIRDLQLLSSWRASPAFAQYSTRRTFSGGTTIFSWTGDGLLGESGGPGAEVGEVEEAERW